MFKHVGITGFARLDPEEGQDFEAAGKKATEFVIESFDSKMNQKWVAFG